MYSSKRVSKNVQASRDSVGSDQFGCLTNRIFQNDSLNTELVYYVGMIQDIVPFLSVYDDRKKILLWIRTLFAAEMLVEELRRKRNRYLFHLVLIILNDAVFGIFKKPPPPRHLPEIEDIQCSEDFYQARWETDRYWDELINGMTEEERIMQCYFHEDCRKNEEGGRTHPRAGGLLDEEFKFFLYLARPYLSLMRSFEEKACAATWILTLAKVNPCSCLVMKTVRNDYMQAMLGYLQDLRLAGPFCYKPPDYGQTLQPLQQLVKLTSKCNTGRPLTDPLSEDAEDFLSEQPIPESGAFCYIGVTGNAKDPEKVSTIPLSTTKYDAYFGI